jgi:hypothetical protein
VKCVKERMKYAQDENVWEGWIKDRNDNRKPK